jgi:hypothetical protein
VAIAPNRPNSVTSIGTYAFYDCINLTDMTVEWETPLSIVSNTFNKIPLSSVTLHVPVGTKALYEAAYVWKEFGYILDDVIVGTEVIRAAGEQVRIYGSLLSVGSPAAGQIAVYSTGGQLLYRVQQPVGPAAFDLNGLPRGVLIVRGSSGWTVKVVK